MNYSMSIPPYHYFSNPKQRHKLFVVGRVLTWEILEGLSFVKRDGEERLDIVSQWCASVPLLAGKQCIILGVNPTLFDWELFVRFKWEVRHSVVSSDCLFLRLAIPWRDFSWRKRPMRLGVHNVGVWRKGLS